ncbi:Universal stress protein [Streptomyces sp. RB5]|uniref:Universal stress protein n=1 Tax=Streptomyces smaragdinus TaxID=2585196 RepID=A0A7K0CPQ9_9ACTN|nr:universal stress protein [Streptomyces smaragdinus]MQY14734.1 Universal stress protein [Streptomyces smaragdinus]
MEPPLVVGVDGSEAALRAVDWAADEAALHGIPLRLVHAAVWERYEGLDPAFGPVRQAERLTADRLLTAAADRAARRQPTVRTDSVVIPDAAAEALLTAGGDGFALVIGSRGHGALHGVLLGSVSLAVAGRAHCPVVVVRGEPRTGRRRVLVGVGDRGAGAAALDFAFREAAASGAALEAVRAWRCPVREELGHPMLALDEADSHESRARTFLTDALAPARLRHPGTRVRPLTAEGPVRRVLLEAAVSADLLVLGATRGHAARTATQLGPAVHSLLHRAPCPVAVIPEA